MLHFNDPARSLHGGLESLSAMSDVPLRFEMTGGHAPSPQHPLIYALNYWHFSRVGIPSALPEKDAGLTSTALPHLHFN